MEIKIFTYTETLSDLESAFFPACSTPSGNVFGTLAGASWQCSWHYFSWQIDSGSPSDVYLAWREGQRWALTSMWASKGVRVRPVGTAPSGRLLSGHGSGEPCRESASSQVWRRRRRQEEKVEEDKAGTKLWKIDKTIPMQLAICAV